MKAIKFRGYVPTYLGMKGYWVYGLLARYNDELATVVTNDKLYTVKSDTIGQFTGLHDKNGVEIYEGDIVQRGDGRKDHVVYLDGEFTTAYERWDVWWLVKHRIEDLDENVVIIGNIHDKEELK